MPIRIHRNLRALTLLFALVAIAAIVNAGEAKTRNASEFQNISGTYSFLREGELIEFNLQEGQIIGDVQRFGSTDADRGVLLTHFFDKASLNKDRLEFTTKTVHGIYYRFTGRIERGEGKTRADEDYYRMVGTLTEYSSDAGKKVSARKREATFKSAPDEMLGEESASDSK
ncbi:MAG: hypothetical protein L0Z53_20220 [Acidobacteriales bacterium]|nr:hypothetical protein [Terriglobales bacterium]